MILLVSGGPRQHITEGHGFLLCPRSRNVIPSGAIWACDNAAFSGFDSRAFVAMLAAIQDREDCLWVACPDVVGDASATDHAWRYWARIITAHGLRPAYVGQDGMRALPANAAAFFLGGTTKWKLGRAAAEFAAEAKRRGLWVHMGRVNSRRRLLYALAIGCDSVDGSGFSRFRDTHIPWASRVLKQAPLRLR